MNILQILSCRTWLGEAERVNYLIRLLIQKGNNVTLICRKDTEVYEKMSGIDRLKIWCIKSKPYYGPLNDIGEGLTILGLLKRKRFDIIHVHRGTDHWNGGVANYISVRKPLIRTRHVTTKVKKHVFNKWLYRYVTNKVITTSETIRQAYIKNNGLPERKVVNIYGAVDTRIYSPSVNSSDIEDELNIPHGVRIVGIVGRFSEIKGFGDFINAALILAGKLDNVHFLIVGHKEDGITVNDMKNRISSAGLSNICHILFGFREDIASIQRRFDVGVIASLGSEGNSRTTLQFMALGVPLVATRVGVIPEMIIDGKTGCLVDIGKPHQIASCVEQILLNKKLADSYSNAARYLIEKNFNFDKFITKIENVYKEVIAGVRT